MPRRTGVALAGGREGAAVERHVHATGSTWTITSTVPCGPALLEAEVLDRLLPGALGRYVYPADAVLHITGKTATRRADFDALLQEEEVVADAEEQARVNHLSVARPVAQAESEEEESDDEEGGEEDDEVLPDKEKAWSDDDDDAKAA
jgi:hypothetical protein